MAPRPTKPPSSSSSWSRTVNGLPVWTWAAIGGLTLAGVFVFVRGYRKAAATPPAADTNTATQGNAPLIIPLPGPPGQSIRGAPGAAGTPGVPGAPGAPGGGLPGPVVLPPIPLPSPGWPRPVPFPIRNPAPIPPPSPIAAPPSVDYTVRPGDTIWAIAGGDAARVSQVIDMNLATLQQWAAQHGQWTPADPGHWIYPGEPLKLPA